MQVFKKMHIFCRFLFLISFLLSGNIVNAQFAENQLLDGNGQAIGTPSGMLNTATVFTIEFWVKTSETRSSATYWQRPTLLGTASGSAPSGDFGITTNNGYIGMWSGLNSSGDNSFLSPTVQLNDNNWHHIAAVNNGSLINLFVDGINIGNISSGLGLATINAPLTIGGDALDFSFSGSIGPNNFFHQGLFDEVRFSKTTRYITNFIPASAAFTNDANTVALYHFDGGCTSGLVPDASTNANNGKPYLLTGSCAFTLPPTPIINANASPAAINKAEIFYDADPGFGAGTDIAVASSTNINGAFTVNTPNTNGVHRLYVRTRDAAKNWSLTNHGTFFIVPPGVLLPANSNPATINKAEYFFDTDPGFNLGADLPVSSGVDVTTSYAVNISGLNTGVHRLYVRTRNSSKIWSLTHVATFFVTPAGFNLPPNPIITSIVKAEYFIDTDPGFGNGQNIPIANGTDITATNAFINISGLSNGVHRVYIRTKNSDGVWSVTNNNYFSIIAASFSLPPNPVAGTITKLEYFIDTDPGFGLGNIVTVPAATDISNYAFAANVSGLNDGTHTIYIRTYDGWSLTNTKTFVVGTITPVNWLTFNAHAVADSVLLHWQTANEKNNLKYEIERSIDGVRFTPIGILQGNGTTSSVSSYYFTDSKPTAGIIYYRIKQVDADGHFTYSVTVSVRYNKENPYVIAYPNPATHVLNVLFNQPQKDMVQLQLISANGQLVQWVSVGGLVSKTIDVSHFANGIYELKVVADKTIATQKIIIQH